MPGAMRFCPSKTVALYALGGAAFGLLFPVAGTLMQAYLVHGSLGLARVDGVEKVDTKVLIYNGKSDPWINEEAKSALKADLESVGADYEFVEFSGAIHGFTNPEATTNGEKFGLPLKHHPVADKASWAHMSAYLEDAFSK